MSRSLVEPRHYLALIAAAFFVTLAPHRHPQPVAPESAHHAVHLVTFALPAHAASTARTGARP